MTEGRRVYPTPRLLSADDERSSFDSESAAQTVWLRTMARQAHSRGSARVYVVTEPDSLAVVGYYAWCMSGIGRKDAPARMLKRAGSYPLYPVALLARLATDARHAGSGIGKMMLQDAVRRIVDIGEQIGCLGLVVHAESEEAVGFYIHHIPDFEPGPAGSNPLHLHLPLADIRRVLRG